MPLMNCWEFMECQREPGGIKTAELGVCPAASDKACDGLNRGKNAGRMCWEIAGTKCEAGPQGTFSAKFHDCPECPFYNLVRAEEDTGFIRSKSPKKP